MLAERPTRSSSPREGGVQISEMQRSRLLAGAVGALAEFGYDGASVARITERARISRRTFYELFDNREECVLAVLESALERIGAELAAAKLDGLSWRERVRGGLWTILCFFDREPTLARVCVVESQRASQGVLERRQEIFDSLAAAIDESGSQRANGHGPVALTGQGVVGGVVSILYAHLLGAEPEPLCDLFGELMAMIVLPYLGARVARTERERPAPVTPSVKATQGNSAAVAPESFDRLAQIPMRLTYRTALVLRDIAEHPDSSNRQVAERAEIHDQGQVSKLLSRLQRLGLLDNGADGAPAKGEANKWRLTPIGMQVTDTIHGHAGDREKQVV